MRVALAFAASLAFLTPAAAEACWNNTETHHRVLGVDPEGWFVVEERDYNEAGEAGEHQAFVLYDAGGHERERASRWETGGAWSAAAPEGGGTARLTPSLSVGAPLAAIARDLQRRLSLEPLRRAERARHVASKTSCGSIELEVEGGWIRALEVGHQSMAGCVPVRATVRRHPRNELVFVETRWEVSPREGREWAIEHDVQWFPQERLDGVAAAKAGERALRRGDARTGARLLARAIRLAPEYIPSRPALVRAHRRLGLPEAETRALLLTPLRAKQLCIGWHELGDLGVRVGDDDPAAWPWDACNRVDASLRNHWSPDDAPAPDPDRSPPEPPLGGAPRAPGALAPLELPAAAEARAGPARADVSRNSPTRARAAVVLAALALGALALARGLRFGLGRCFGWPWSS